MVSLTSIGFALPLVIGVFLFGLGSQAAGGSGSVFQGGIGGLSSSDSPQVLTSSNVTSSALCAQLEARDPGMDLAFFSEICHERQFVSAFAHWNQTQFVGQSEAGQSGQLVDYVYIVGGEAACGNRSSGPPSAICDEQITWLGNVSTGVLTGPFYSEYFCYNPACIAFGNYRSPSPLLSGAGEAALLVVGSVAIAVAAVLYIRQRRLWTD